MSWEIYRLVYKVKSPVCIGFHKLGFIQRTRPYILGRNIWGAFTAELTRFMGNNRYEVIGERLKEYFRFMPFFPAIDPDSPFLPVYAPRHGLLYRNGINTDLKESQFERLFINAYGRTAVSPDYLAAEEGSLFETEFINPHVMTEDGLRQVYFIGYLFKKKESEHDESNQSLFYRALERIAVGGERKYGFGQLERISLDKEQTNVFGNRPNLHNSNGPEFNMVQGAHLFMHLYHLYNENQPINLYGDIEPVVGLEYSSGAGFGQQISKANVCWMPGAEIKEESGLKIILGKEPLSIAIFKE